MNGTPIKEAEERLLSAIIFNSEDAVSRIGFLTEEMFSVRKYGALYSIMTEMADAGEDVDYVSVCNRVDWIKPSELIGMVDRFIPTTQYVRTDVAIITDAYKKRRLQERFAQIAQDSLDSTEMLSLVQDELDSLNDIAPHSDGTLESQAVEWLDGLRDALDNGGTTGIQSRYSAYNMMTGGYRGGHLVVVGARPKVGKTTYATNEIHHLASTGVRTGVISLEMGSDEIITKLAGIDSNLKGLNFMTDEKLLSAVKAKERITKLPLFIEDNVSSDYRAIMNKCRQLIRKNDVEVIVIDYLQLMTGDANKNRNNEISEITRSLKQFARRYRIPIILLSQLSRLSERENNRRPRFSDLRDSGSIEQDANVIVFLHRESDDSDTLEVIVAGNRGGSTGYFTVRFDKPASRMDAIDNRRE